MKRVRREEEEDADVHVGVLQPDALPDDGLVVLRRVLLLLLGLGLLNGVAHPLEHLSVPAGRPPRSRHLPFLRPLVRLLAELIKLVAWAVWAGLQRGRWSHTCN